MGSMYRRSKYFSVGLSLVVLAAGVLILFKFSASLGREALEQEVEFTGRSFPVVAFAGGPTGIPGYSKSAAALLASGKGTVTKPSNMASFSNVATLPEYIYATTGVDLRAELLKAAADAVEKPVVVSFQARPSSRSWRSYNQYFPDASYPPFLLVIFPARMVPGYIPVFPDQPDLGYLFLNDFTKQFAHAVYYDACNLPQSPDDTNRSRFIREFAVRHDQFGELVAVFAEVYRATCR